MTKQQKLKNVRVRLAPSPTGPLHIGNARTALFNYLFAQQHKGMLVLRIEDTDKERSKKEYEQNIFDGLKWLGIEWQEGPDIDGATGPYRQSERTEIYQRYIQKLLDEENLYHCFCTPEDLESHRQYLMSIGEAPRYSGKCRELRPQEIKKNLEQGRPYILRFKTPKKKIAFNDMLRGRIEYDAEIFGDMAVAKSPTEPLYNLACVIDDFEMKITHVIRGEDHISNTPKQILLSGALGIDPPQYLHLPLILAPDRSKLSKRHGAVSLCEYKEQGYLPEAMVNFLALLGWSPGDEREVFTMKDLIREFSIEKLQKSGAVFNIRKLDWLNGHYLRNISLNKLTEACVPRLIENGLVVPLWGQQELITGAYKMPFDIIEYQVTETGQKVSFDYLKAAVGLYQTRVKKLSEISELIDFFFKEELDYPGELLKWKDMDSKETKVSLDRAYKLLDNIKEGGWTEENIGKTLMPEAEKATLAAEAASSGAKAGLPTEAPSSAPPDGGASAGKSAKVGDRGWLLWPLRVALSGKKASAGPFEIAEVLGKEKTLQRIKQAKQKIKNKEL